MSQSAGASSSGWKVQKYEALGIGLLYTKKSITEDLKNAQWNKNAPMLYLQFLIA